MDSHSIIGTKNKKGQTYTDPYHLFFEAPRIPSFFTGIEVIKEAIRRASADLMVAYPITPQSEAAALIGEDGGGLLRLDSNGLRGGGAARRPPANCNLLRRVLRPVHKGRREPAARRHVPAPVCSVPVAWPLHGNGMPAGPHDA